MREFYVPFDVETEDKIIGGKLTLRQGLYIGLIFVLAFFFFFIKEELSTTEIIIKAVLLVIIAIACIVLSFVKKNEFYLDKYLYLLIAFKLRRKVFIYKKY